MNCPSRVDETLENEGWNQNPPSLAADLTTRQDLNGIANSRRQRDHKQDHNGDESRDWMARADSQGDAEQNPAATGDKHRGDPAPPPARSHSSTASPGGGAPPTEHFNVYPSRGQPSRGAGLKLRLHGLLRVFTKFARFIGPGFMIAVAYIDPGNYATDVAAGATFRFRLLFIVLMSNLFAIFLQSLCIKLGSVTGLNLAEHCKAHLPKWLNILLYLFAEAAIIATDIAEVGHGHLKVLAVGRRLNDFTTGYRFRYSFESAPQNPPRCGLRNNIGGCSNNSTFL